MPGFELFDDAERQAVGRVLDAGQLSRYGYGPDRENQSLARQFETALCQRIGAGFCHLCSSGTAALSTALAACGIGAGDEVIVPPFTFIATVEAVINAGAVPVFSEIDETLCLDPERLPAALTPRTKAVLLVHMCGSMARVDAVKDFCDKNRLVLMEDACQALGGSFKGKYLGTFGRTGCFSFDSVKTITCGEGGCVVTADRDCYLAADAFADHGHDHAGADRGKDNHPLLGLNYRISELNAAIGVAQLSKLDRILSIQRTNKKFIKEAIAPLPGVTFRNIPDEAGDSATFLSFFLPDEARTRAVAAGLAGAGGIPCFYWYANNWHYLRQWDHVRELRAPARLPVALVDGLPDYSRVALPRSDAIMSRCLSIQIKLSWDVKERAGIVEKLKTVLKNSQGA